MECRGRDARVPGSSVSGQFRGTHVGGRQRRGAVEVTQKLNCSSQNPLASPREFHYHPAAKLKRSGVGRCRGGGSPSLCAPSSWPRPAASRRARIRMTPISTRLPSSVTVGHGRSAIMVPPGPLRMEDVTGGLCDCHWICRCSQPAF
mgnify:CR=1 FL=1